MLPYNNNTEVDNKNVHTDSSVQALCASSFHLHHATLSSVPERECAFPP